MSSHGWSKQSEIQLKRYASLNKHEIISLWLDQHQLWQYISPIMRSVLIEYSFLTNLGTWNESELHNVRQSFFAFYFWKYLKPHKQVLETNWSVIRRLQQKNISFLRVNKYSENNIAVILQPCVISEQCLQPKSCYRKCGGELMSKEWNSLLTPWARRPQNIRWFNKSKLTS